MRPNEEATSRLELMQGTLDMLIPRTLVLGPAHGHEIAKHIQRTTDHVLQDGLASHKTPQFYVPNSQYACATSNLLFRTADDPWRLASAVRAELGRIDPALITPQFASMNQFLAASIVPQQFSTTLLMILGVSGLLLAAVGIYGVISYSVAQRTSELAVRIALGAAPSNILYLVMKQGMHPVLIGALAGIGPCFPATHFIVHLLFRTGRLEPLTLMIVAVVLIGAALLACYIPARCAMKVDPMVPCVTSREAGACRAAQKLT